MARLRGHDRVEGKTDGFAQVEGENDKGNHENKIICVTLPWLHLGRLLRASTVQTDDDGDGDTT